MFEIMIREFLTMKLQYRYFSRYIMIVFNDFKKWGWNISFQLKRELFDIMFEIT